MLNLNAAERLLSRMPIRDLMSGSLVDFKLKYNQIIALDMLKKQAADGKPLRAMFTKARRVGVSSMIEGLGVAHCIAEVNARAMVVAHQQTTAKDLFNVPITLVKGLGQTGYDLPDPTQQKITFPHSAGDSTLSVATAGNLIGGRGMAFSFLHLSEAAYYLGRAPFTSLLPAVPDHPSTAIFIESTANGKVGPGEAFYRMWLDAVEHKNEYLAIFLGWIDDLNCRRDAEEAIRDCPANDDEKDILHLVACEKFCGRCEGCHKALECISWRRWAVENICQGDIDNFHQEYPVNWQEAFITSKNPAFTREEQRLAAIHIRPAVHIGKLEYDVSPAAATDKPIVFIPDSRSPLHIWAMPKAKHHYYIGADAARGEDNKDFAAAYVWCGETGEGCARYASRINPESLAELLNYLGIFYNRAMLAVELTGNLGLWTQKVLRDTYRYPNLYHWKGRDDRQQIGYVQRTAVGWETTGRTRGLMLDAFRSGIRFGRCKLFDDSLLTQMQMAEMIEGRWEVRSGHDDILMAAMIGWIAGEQWHHGGLGNSHKVLDIEGGLPDDPTQDSSSKIIRTADPDVQGMARRHWLKLQGWIKRGNAPHDPLEGI